MAREKNFFNLVIYAPISSQSELVKNFGRTANFIHPFDLLFKFNLIDISFCYYNFSEYQIFSDLKDLMFLGEETAADVLKNIFIEIHKKETFVFDLEEIELNFRHRHFIVLLLPAEKVGSFECQITINDDGKDTDLVVATNDDNWEQIVIRAICSKLGLIDEFELEGEINEHPSVFSEYMIKNIYPNLLHLHGNPDLINLSETKWDNLAISFNKQLKINRHSGHPNQLDHSLPEFNYTPEEIELWEGGGGYRTKVFRAAHDCLMRRRIGDKNLPVRTSRVPLCPACENYLRSLIFDFGRRNNIEELDFRGFIQKI